MKDAPDWMISEIVAGDICMVVKNAGLPKFDYLLGTLVRVVSIEPNGRFSDPTILPMNVPLNTPIYTAMIEGERLLGSMDWNVGFVREELKKIEPLTEDEEFDEIMDTVVTAFALGDM